MVELLEEGVAPARLGASGRAVVVHSGARDGYQVALALEEWGMLEALVTDLYWPADRGWAGRVESRLSPGARDLVRRRSVAGLPSSRVEQCKWAGLRGLVLGKVPRVPFPVRRRSERAADATLGRAAGRRARSSGAGLLTYSYYGYDAMREYGRPAMLFQVHPHPATVRRLLLEELEAHPECSASLLKEWELALPEEDFRHLVEEPKMASCLLAASSFTRDSLVENGVRKEDVTVIPYGVDLEHYRPDARRRGPADGPLELLFVGRINQRKGIKYLLQALRMVGSKRVHLTVCGRVVDGLELFREFGEQVTVRPSVSGEELVAAYQAADLFVFPSVAEGFGQVLLEALACGLPILSTTNTAAPDLIEEELEGFVVEPRRPELLAERIEWAATHRGELRAMGEAARVRAECYPWRRFRVEVGAAVGRYLA